MSRHRTEHETPEAMLAHARTGYEAWLKAPVGTQAERDTSEQAIACYQALDEWVTKGGELPSEWLRALTGTGDDQRTVVRAYQEMETAAGKHHALTYADISRAFRAAMHGLAERNAEIARLKAELDGYQGHQVTHGTEALCLQIVNGSGTVPVPPGITEGAILRATDTHREWTYSDGKWQDRRA